MTMKIAELFCLEIILFFLGAHVNSRTAEGMTPLHFAAYGGHLNCLGVLLRADADVHATTR